jgi:hypothetical protein
MIFTLQKKLVFKLSREDLRGATHACAGEGLFCPVVLNVSKIMQQLNPTYPSDLRETVGHTAQVFKYRRQS